MMYGPIDPINRDHTLQDQLLKLGIRMENLPDLWASTQVDIVSTKVETGGKKKRPRR